MAVQRVIGLQGGGRIILSADIGDTLQRLDAQRIYLADPAPLLKKWGAIIRKDARRQFATGGDPKWKGLAPSTIAAKLIAGVPHRNKNGNVQRRLMQNGSLSAGSILIAKGNLRDSWSVLRDPNHVEILDIPHMFVEEGSRDPVAIFHQYGTKPYKIVPKAGKSLAFVGAGGKIVVTGKTINHPGLPARPVLITETAREEIIQVTVDHILGEAKRDEREDQ